MKVLGGFTILLSIMMLLAAAPVFIKGGRSSDKDYMVGGILFIVVGLLLFRSGMRDWKESKQIV